jgi:hypothetical protein
MSCYLFIDHVVFGFGGFVFGLGINMSGRNRVRHKPDTQTCFVSPSGHYRTNIINGVGYLRSNSVVPLVLCTVVCNGWGNNIVL